ncbi:hypothetical protein L6164_032499 [Bauhinia variegata]|uniref:Uncharacterized protein n=1 Tax=Bauhinia variegata TaxID=167791 RepID=A0ACB9KNT9_BAUVA|nr:hypothetical protein L6164_032499 [Bauhinia variegata]
MKFLVICGTQNFLTTANGATSKKQGFIRWAIVLGVQNSRQHKLRRSTLSFADTSIHALRNKDNHGVLSYITGGGSSEGFFDTCPALLTVNDAVAFSGGLILGEFVLLGILVLIIDRQYPRAPQLGTIMYW